MELADHTRDLTSAHSAMEEIGRVIRGERYVSNEVLDGLRMRIMRSMQRLSNAERLDIMEDMLLQLLVIGAQFARDNAPFTVSARESPTQPDAAAQPLEGPAHPTHPRD